MHAVLLAAALWIVAAGLMVLGTPYRDPFGQLKWTDFVHFYTLGDIARHGPVSALYDPEAQYRRQTELVPESAPERYLPVYPPQIALVFAPFSRLPYHAAAWSWALLNFVVFGAIVWLAWRPLRAVLTDRALIVAAAAAFPPVWSLVLSGQTTALPMIAFSAGAIALSRGRPVLAGVALGLLFMKPQFGLMLAVVIVACREWSLFAGVVLSGIVQSILVAGLLGSAVLRDYMRVVTYLPGIQGALEPSMDQMHSLSAMTRVLPSPVGTVVWLTACVWVSWLTVRVWRNTTHVPVRMGALVIGSMLVNPHVNFYDVSVMAAPLLWISEVFESRSERLYELRHRWRLAVYAYYALLLAPTARLITSQLSPIVPLWLIYTLARVGVASPVREGGANVDLTQDSAHVRSRTS